MSNLSTFRFENRSDIRVVQNDAGDPWFVAGDICRTLAIVNVGNALSRLDDDEKNTIRLMDGTPGNPNVAIVSESGLYSLIVRSDKPEAKTFRKWVTSEVLPSIRKTGVYAIKPMTPAEMMVAQAQMMLDHERRLEALENQVKEQQAERQEAEQLMLALPAPTIHAPKKSLRADLNERVRATARARSLHYAFIWNDLYRELRYRDSFDAVARARLCKKEPLDIVEEAGKMEVLYAIACEVLA